MNTSRQLGWVFVWALGCLTLARPVWANPPAGLLDFADNGSFERVYAVNSEGRARFLKKQRAGADGLCWWDAEPFATTTNWGNRAELEVWAGIKPLFLGPMHTVGAFLVDEMPAYNAF